ncbi:tail sheath [Pseudomonas phage Lu11]|uniref:tail sheath n=1 Tax=Pseudomonas phage Lu11 TaxID=1161927 RepID=UPI00025F1517|nr:tail sheath [Pseudomonas phage Lu11]AFH14592.1 putative tail sheath protein [Pseudomonas phage Lu11]
MPLQNGSNTSSGVYGGERNNAISATTTYPSTGAIVGESNRGPVGIPVLTTSKEEFRAKFGLRDPSLTFAHFAAERFLKKSQRLWFLRVDTGAEYGNASVRTVEGFAVPHAATQGYLDPTEHNQIPEEILFIYGANPGEWNNGIRVLMYPDVNDVENELFWLQVFETNMSVPVETYRGTLRDKTSGFNQQTNIAYQLEAADSRIRLKINENHPEYVRSNGAARLINAIVQVDLSYGTNGAKAHAGQIIDGWEQFDNEDDFELRILINAGYADAGVHQAMIALAEGRRDCTAILDIPSDLQTVARAVDYRRNVLNSNSSFAAMYCSDILERTDDNQEIYVPCSGAIAAVYAQSDRDKDVFWAPAGVNRGVIEDISGVRHRYSLPERNILDQNQINMIHYQASYGFCVWGAQTLQSQKSPLQDVPVRRLINMIETTAKYDVLVGLFDPNDEFLWAQLRGVVERILEPIKRAQGVYFSKVICDKTTNPPEQVANGDVCLVYIIQPTRYAKRILFTATVAQTGDINTAIELALNS